MTAVLPDPATSRAVLVGVSRYTRMTEDRQLPAVENNLGRLASLLGEERIWGLPAENCRVLHQPDDPDAVIEALREAAEQAEDTLLFYYAGHGLTDPLVDHGGLYLALPRAYEPGGTHLALHYNQVRARLRVATAVRRTVILDCCWSGRALETTMGAEDFAAATDIESTTVLTASAATATALAPAGEQYTAFTGALLGLLDQGIQDGPPLLDAHTLYRQLHLRLAGSGRPLPQLGGSGAEVVFARNTAAGQRDPVSSAPVADPVNVHAPGVLVRDHIRGLERTGQYEGAKQARLRAAEFGDEESIRELAADLRYRGEYVQAEELERMAATTSEGALGEFLRRFHA